MQCYLDCGGLFGDTYAECQVDRLEWLRRSNLTQEERR